MERQVKLYAISTCAWCKKAKKLLEDCGIEYEVEHVDLLTGEDKERVRGEVKKHNPRVSYPTIIVDDEEVIVGFDEERIKEILGL